MRALGRLHAMRTRAETLFGCTFTAYAPNGFTTVNGLEVQAYADQGSTAGKIQGSIAKDGVTRSVTVGGVTRSILEEGLHIPISAPLPVSGDQGIGWEYQCTAVADPADANLVGRRFLVVNVPAKSYATARRLDVVEVPL